MSPTRGELEMVSLLAARLPAAPAGEVWIGDDAAVLPAPDGYLLLTVDTVVQDVHFDPALASPADAGWKALSTSVSDLAAMGGSPLRAVVAATFPDPEVLDAVYDGVLAAAAEASCPVVGGDLSSGPALVLSVAATGSVPRGEPAPVLRSGASPGDRLWVTGRLGSSAAGLAALRAGRGADPACARLVEAHLRPRARLAEGRAARLAGASAMIDLSDGLGIDLGRLAAASGVAVELESVPTAEGATEADAVGGGEDYELAFCAPERVDMAHAFTATGLAPPLEIGRCTDGPTGSVLLGGRRLEPAGYVHWR